MRNAPVGLGGSAQQFGFSGFKDLQTIFHARLATAAAPPPFAPASWTEAKAALGML
jgi:hypothetical protein